MEGAASGRRSLGAAAGEDARESVGGATFEPDLYRWAITIAGVFDWEQMMMEARFDQQSVQLGTYSRFLGNSKKEREKLAAISPLGHTDRIKVPVFVAHSDKDGVAAIAQSTHLVAALEKRAVPDEVMIKLTEGRGFSKLDNRLDLSTAIKAFLARHATSRPPAAPTGGS